MAKEVRRWCDEPRFFVQRDTRAVLVMTKTTL
jgi:hypothetical protein